MADPVRTLGDGCPESLEELSLEDLVEEHMSSVEARRALEREDAPRMLEVRGRVSGFINGVIARHSRGFVSHFGNFDVKLDRGAEGAAVVRVSGLDNTYVKMNNGDNLTVAQVLKESGYNVNAFGSRFGFSCDLGELEKETGVVGETVVDATVGASAEVAAVAEIAGKVGGASVPRADDGDEGVNRAL